MRQAFEKKPDSYNLGKRVLGTDVPGIALDDIREGVSNLEFTNTSEEINLEAEGIYFTGPVIAKLNLFKQDYHVYVKAELSIAMELECARCLRTVQMILRGTSENQYRPLPKVARYPLDDIGIRYYSGEHIDMSDDFRETLLLELPVRVLCSENCKGLCPRCGKNLNEESCNCHPEADEVQIPKFANLIKILTRDGL